MKLPSGVSKGNPPQITHPDILFSALMSLGWVSVFPQGLTVPQQSTREAWLSFLIAKARQDPVSGTEGKGSGIKDMPSLSLSLADKGKSSFIYVHTQHRHTVLASNVASVAVAQQGLAA